MSETIEEICESLRHSLDDETCEWYENRTDDERQWYSDLADRIESAHKAELVAISRSKHSETRVEYAVGRNGPYGIVVEGPTYSTRQSALIDSEYSDGFVVARRVGKWMKGDVE